MQDRFPHREDPGYPDEFVEESDQREFDLLAYVDILRRHWRWVLGTGVLAMAAAWFLQRDVVSYPLYSADVLVQRRAPGEDLGDLGFGLGRRQADELASEMAILRTGQVLGAVVDSTGLRLTLPEEPALRGELFGSVEISPEAAPREYRLEGRGEGAVLLAAGQEVASAGPDEALIGPGLVLEVLDPAGIPDAGVRLEIVTRGEAIRRLDESLGTEHPQRTNLIRIEYSGPDPVQAARVANALAAAYQEQAAMRAREEMRRRRAFLSGRLESVSDSLRMAQEVLLDFQAMSQTVNPQSEGQTLSGQLLRAEEELRAARSRERTLQDLLGNLEDGGREGLRQMVILGDILPGGGALYTRLQEYEDRRSELVNVSRRTEQSPDVQLLDSLIAETKGEMRLTVEQSLRLAQQDRQAAEGRATELRQQLGDVPERNVAYGRLEQRVAAIQKMHDMLAERFYEAQISEAIEAGDIEIVDPAVVPTDSSGTYGRTVHPLLALLGGMVLGFVGVVAREKLNTKVRGADEVRRLTGTEIIGTVPVLDTEAGIRPIIATNGAVAAEAFRMLRTNIRFARAEAVRTMAVTSSGPAEGKSVVSMNLAIALAQEGKSVLLVDADLRRPVLHTALGEEREPGLTDLLVGGQMASAVRRGEWEFDLVTAGTAVPNPAELVGSPAFRKFIEMASQKYDIVVLDTPPVLAVSDASVISSQVDGVILVVRQDRTPRNALGDTGDQLRRARASILGVVVNAVETTGRYGGGGYYGYGYGYGAGEYLAENGKPQGVAKRWLSRLPFSGKEG